MKCKYDFHIHTCLSPCASEDNTPNNVVNFAKMLGYDAIAICDHNSAKNVAACMAVGESIGLLVIAGMEVTTSEDIHIVCLFPSLESVEKLDKIVEERMFKTQNDEKIFGTQIVMNEKDEEISRLPHLLLYGVDIGVYEISKIVKDLGGVCFPAHVFREGSGILPILGGIDEDMGFFAIERGRGVTDKELQSANLGEYFTLDNSDAHYLEDFREAESYLDCEITKEGIFEYFRAIEELYKANK